MKIEHPYILDILTYSYYYVSNQGKIVNFCQIPSPIGIHGNNEAKFEIVNFKIPSSYLKHFIKLYIKSLSQIRWDFCDTSKLYSIQNKVNIPYNFNLKRSDQVIFSRIRIGHSKLTHIYLLKGENILSVFSVIVLKFDFTFYIFGMFRHLTGEEFLNNVNSMQDLFTKVNVSDILELSQECDFHKKISDFQTFTFLTFI